jgi:hypothetical protein
VPGDGQPSPVHGKKGYLYYGCRCPVCTEANAQRGREQRAARLLRTEAGDPAVPHGTAGGYTNWGCRCPGCTKANTERCLARRRARRKEASVTIP